MVKQAMGAMLAIGLGVALAAVPTTHAEATRSARASAPESAAAAAPATAGTPLAEDPLGKATTPRQAVHAFLTAARDGAYAEAARFVDLRAVAPARRAELARQLKAVLDRTIWVDFEAVSDAPEGDREDGLDPSRDRLGTVDTAGGRVDILLERRAAPGGARVWAFASETATQIPALYATHGPGALADLLPAPLVELRVFEVRLWQWIGLLVLLVFAAAFSWLATVIVMGAARSMARRSATSFDDALLEAAAGPVRFGVALGVAALGIYALALALPVQRFLLGVEKALAVLAVAWFLMRLIDILAEGMERRFRERGNLTATGVVPLGRRTVKVFLAILALLAMVQNFGFNVTGILAGLGVGGLAVALAAQKTVENLFGGVTLITDQPVRVGDFCRFGDRVGTVEDVGLRSTRVRTLDRSVVTIPNADFASMQLENFAQRDRIWLQTTLGLRYETTPDQLRWVLVEVKKLLLSHPKIDPAPARIRFTGFGAYSLDLEIFAYVLTADINEFLAIREDVYLRIMDVVATSGSGFAFPSQTLYAAADGGLDAERSRAAEEQVRAWRAEHTLPLPDPSSEMAAELRGSLAYPPEGSSGR